MNLTAENVICTLPSETDLLWANFMFDKDSLYLYNYEKSMNITFNTNAENDNVYDVFQLDVITTFPY